MPSTLNLVSPIIIVAKKKDSSTQSHTEWKVTFRKINELFEYWSYPLMRRDKILSELHETKQLFTPGVQSDFNSITIYGNELPLNFYDIINIYIGSIECLLLNTSFIPGNISCTMCIIMYYF